MTKKEVLPRTFGDLLRLGCAVRANASGIGVIVIYPQIAQSQSPTKAKGVCENCPRELPRQFAAKNPDARLCPDCQSKADVAKMVLAAAARA